MNVDSANLASKQKKSKKQPKQEIRHPLLYTTNTQQLTEAEKTIFSTLSILSYTSQKSHLIPRSKATNSSASSHPDAKTRSPKRLRFV